MGYKEITHNPNLSKEERREEVGKLNNKYRAYLEEALSKHKYKEVDYFIDTWNTNRAKLLGENTGRLSRGDSILEVLFDNFLTESLEVVAMSLHLYKFEDLPTLMSTSKEGTLKHTFLLWRLRVGC